MCADLAEVIVGLPLPVYRTGTGGSIVKAANHGLYRLWHDEPNPEMTSFMFRETLIAHLLQWGQRLRPVAT